MSSAFSVAMKDMGYLIEAAEANMKYLPGPVINVKGYGAKGDGIKDDTYAILSAISTLKSQGGGELHFPPGTYLYKQTLIIDFYCRISGSSTLPTILRPDKCGGLKILSSFVQVENINIDSGVAATDSTSTIGVEALDSGALYMTSVYIKNMGVGFYLNDGPDGDTYGGHYGIYNGCHFVYCNYGIRINNVSNMQNFIGGAVLNNRIKGIEIFDTENVNFYGVSIESHTALQPGETVNTLIANGKLAVHIRSSIATSLNPNVVTKVTFRDCWFEIGNAFVESGNVTFDGCRIINLFNVFGYTPINFTNINKLTTTPNLSPPVDTWSTGANVALTTAKAYDAPGKRNYYKVTSTAGAGAFKAVFGLSPDVQGATTESRLAIGFWIKKVTTKNTVYPILVVTDMNGHSLTANLTTYFPAFNQNSTEWQYVGAIIGLRGTVLDTIVKDATIRVELAAVDQDAATVNSPTGYSEVWIGESPVIRVLDMSPELVGSQPYVRRGKKPWIAPTLQNSWANFGGTFSTAGYYIDDFGVVHLQGTVRTGTIGTAIFTLPEGYRSPTTRYISTVANDLFASVKINTDGTVVANTGANTWFSLDGISFRV